MSTATEISRLQTARNTIRNKLITFGLAESADKLDTLATAIDGISYQGAISATVQEGDTYTIPQGYHNGSGTVSGVAGGGNYTLQTKGPITPTKNQINVAPDNGYYGLSAVTIDPIPEAYQDVTAVTATASQVLATKIFVTSDGTITTGTMTNNGAVSQTLSATSTSYTVPSGYHNGSGIVKIVTETKSATPSTASQDITPTSGKVLSKVTVEAIPSRYANTYGDTAYAGGLLSGLTAHSYRNDIDAAYQITGSMPNIGAASSILDTSHTSYTIPSGYHNGSGSVSIALESKSATPSTSDQTITPTSGKVLSSVTVEKIPIVYGNTTGDTATADHILSGYKAHSSSGGAEPYAVALTGTMPNKGKVTARLGTTSGYHTLFTIPSGYHNGQGFVDIDPQTKTATPSISSQVIKPDSGKVLASVTVDAIPSAYQDVTGVTAVASHVLTGEVFVDATGSSVTGTMANRSTIYQIITTGVPSFTIPEGYHDGNGRVYIEPEDKTATPSTTSQNITASVLKVLNKVTVEAIPSNFKDTTGVTAATSQVLAGTSFVNSTGLVAGTMPNIGAVSSVLDTSHTSYTIPSGYHNGSGMVSLVTETKSATPSTASQDITPTSGKVLSKVTVAAIPSKYGDTTGDDAVAANILYGKKAHSISGGGAVALTGSMTNQGAIAGTIDGLTTLSYTVPAGYHNGSGTVSLTSDIETALASI